ncbi:PDZ domain-containing protein 4-like, partial [Hypanus sabinus]|uniref:PDZ domain-containing protein 4-like n=1 Tax=Hypanus sabinus TaxID=79690 RepID=UPI0028C3ADBF
MLHGKEACRVSQETPAETLRLPREPLVIQVMRRSPRGKAAAGSAPEPQLVDNGTQTDITFEHIMALSKARPPSPPPVLLEPPALGNDFYEANDYLDSGHHEVDRSEDLEYE